MIDHSWHLSPKCRIRITSCASTATGGADGDEADDHKAAISPREGGPHPAGRMETKLCVLSRPQDISSCFRGDHSWVYFMWGRNHIQLFLVVALRRAGDVSSHLCSNPNKCLKPDCDVLIQTGLNKKPSVWSYLWFCRKLVIRLDINAVRSVLQFFCLLQFVSSDRSVSLPRCVCQKHLNSLNTAGNRFDTSWWKQSQWSLKCLTSCWWSLVWLQALLKPLQRPGSVPGLRFGNHPASGGFFTALILGF